MLHMSKRINMKQAESAAQNHKAVWPMIVAGAAVVVTWSWMDPDGFDRSATGTLSLMQILAQQGLDIISAHLMQLRNMSG